MEVWEVLNKAKHDAGLSDRALSEKVSRSSGYFSALKAQKRALKAATLARLLGACGYALAAVPFEALTSNALVIDADGKSGDQDAS